MKLTELVSLLQATGYPVAHSHFIDGAPPIPYITYITPNDTGFKADNKNYFNITDVDIELYTDKKDLQAEYAIESILNENELPYDAAQIYIDSEEVFQRIYEVRLI